VIHTEARGLQAIVSAGQAIKLGDCDVAVAGGPDDPFLPARTLA
jgi:3-oxoacyl-(acyl-carrier-protein) synthase